MHPGASTSIADCRQRADSACISRCIDGPRRIARTDRGRQRSDQRVTRRRRSREQLPGSPVLARLRGRVTRGAGSIRHTSRDEPGGRAMRTMRAHVSRITSTARPGARLSRVDSTRLVSSLTSIAGIATPSQCAIRPSEPLEEILAIGGQNDPREGDRAALPISYALDARTISSSRRGRSIASSATKVGNVASVTARTHGAIGFADPMVRGT